MMRNVFLKGSAIGCPCASGQPPIDQECVPLSDIEAGPSCVFVPTPRLDPSWVQEHGQSLLIRAPEFLLEIHEDALDLFSILTEKANLPALPSTPHGVREVDIESEEVRGERVTGRQDTHYLWCR